MVACSDMAHGPVAYRFTVPAMPPPTAKAARRAPCGDSRRISVRGYLSLGPYQYVDSIIVGAVVIEKLN
jgi:hypothetical protein